MSNTNGNQGSEMKLASDSRIGSVPILLWVVAGKMVTTPRDLAGLGDRDNLKVEPRNPVCLSAGGVDVAVGRIVEEEGRKFFEVEEVL